MRVRVWRRCKTNHGSTAQSRLARILESVKGYENPRLPPPSISPTPLFCSFDCNFCTLQKIGENSVYTTMFATSSSIFHRGPVLIIA